MCYLDLDDPLRMPAPPKPATPTWEKLGAPMTIRLVGSPPGSPQGIEITSTMLHEAAATFREEVPVEPALDPFPPIRCWGWIERVEMREDELWGFVRWVAPLRPPLGVTAVLNLAPRDPETGARAPVRLHCAVLRPAVPARPSVAA